MSFEPEKFFIGLMDFFSILLPGAMAVFLLMDWAPAIIGVNKYNSLSLEARWALFFASSYLLGHFVFLVGARFLDDYVYDPIRDYRRKQIKKLGAGKNLSPKWARDVLIFFIRKDADEPLFKAMRIKEFYLAPFNASSSINTFQWCKARLTNENPGAFEIVQRFEADAKFFRSFVVVLSVLFFGIIVRMIFGFYDMENVMTGFILFLLLCLALWRYIDQRLKSITQAYWYIITMEAAKLSALPAVSSDESIPTHAGGIVYRKINGVIKFLFVSASKNEKEWVLPKGHTESAEDWKQTAVREVREEANIWAKVKGEIDKLPFTFNGTKINVQVYLMEFLEEGKDKTKRKKIWLTLEEAKSNTKIRLDTRNFLDRVSGLLPGANAVQTV
jgi:ADP-ribose pyrophosphatase YjhB (NUDIX family)